MISTTTTFGFSGGFFVIIFLVLFNRSLVRKYEINT